ncbi:hypothetical protein TTHERM_00785820 (macronuclear) [Tetrahymena thermophila SB210]|uniref:EF-hand domain-containing protein n=1 Tax=Tetrahymena thermophila (strain SB210) TaxID=312017 RepID=Q23ZI2_TETTS|nr:hypothetical protein TTHERM_00785820 [Tetrahymena thermophila SB210]EAS01875.2 hypothetical protein TTHERM_00785820 [Tetrahymena thermophila SB210]|eukprot:XP_001022120.2 hypothetical protein TTHERM_00785820 [Tetrahymena thermophila SB210]
MQNYFSQQNQSMNSQQQQDYVQAGNRTNIQPQLIDPETNNSGYGGQYNSQQQISQEDINFINNLQQKQFMQQQMNQIAHNKQTLKKKEILVMTIDIGNGQSGKIHVFENDNPYDLAVKFVAQYDLPPCIVEILEENIKQNVDQVQKTNQQQYMQYESSKQSPISDKVGQQISQDNFGNEQQLSNQIIQNNPYANNQLPMNNYYNEQKKTNQYVKNPPNTQNQMPQSSIQDSFDARQNSTKANCSANRSGVLTPSTKRINKDYPDVNSSMKRRIYYPEGIVEKIDNNSFEKYMNINASTDVGNSLNYSVPAGVSHSNSYHQNAHQISQSFYAGQNYLSSQYNNNGNQSRVEESNNKVNKSFDFGKKQSVHERLFAQSKIKNIQQRETERSNSQANVQKKRVQRSSSLNEINYGIRLYQRGVKQREEKKKQIEKKKQEEINQVQQQCTYHPQINEISSIIAKSLRNEPVGEFLQKVAKQQRERKERARSFKLNSELDGCSFRPEINQISSQIAQEKMNILINQSHEDGKSLNQSFIRNRYDLLYEDSKSKIERKIQRDKHLKIDQNCTFQPKINTFSKILMNDISFFERLQRYSSKENHNSNQSNGQQQGFIDPYTGQEYFKPITGRPPKKQRNQINQSVGEYLYEQSKIKQIQKQQNLQSHNSSVNRSFACEKSTRIIDLKKKQKLIEIFNQLDSDQDGQISAQAIDIQSLDPLILEAFSPLLCEMEELDQALTLEEFIQASEKLVQGLNIQERNQIFNTKKTKCSEESFEFKPRLNPKSVKIAQQKRPHSNGAALYDIFMDEKQKFDQKIQVLRERKEKSELEECTFTPNIQPLYQNYNSLSASNQKNNYNLSNKMVNVQPQSFQNYIDSKNSSNSAEQKGFQQQNLHNQQIMNQPVNYSMFSYQDYQKLFENKNNNYLFGNQMFQPQQQNLFEQNNNSNQKILNFENYNPQ